MNNMIPPLRILPAETGVGVPSASAGSPEGGFLETMQSAMQEIQQIQGSADTQVADLLEGRGTDIHSAMIAVEKADLSFQLMLEVRNKIVSAYQEISRMQF